MTKASELSQLPSFIEANTTNLIVNATSYAIGSSFIANTTGVYHTGTVNASSITTTGLVANVTGVYPTSNTSGTDLGVSNRRWVVNANTINASGLVTALAGANITGTANLVDVNISGNLTVSGTTTYINTTTLNVGDNIVSLNADLGALVAPTENAGLEINRGSAANVSFCWNETTDSWTSGNTDITGYANASVSVNSALLTVGTSFIANTTGAYHTGSVNAASFTVGSSLIANSTALTTASNTATIGTAAYVVANGNVGIGTASPTSKLHVVNATDISMSEAADGQLKITGNGYSAAFALDTTALNIYHNSSSRGIIFGTNETERMRIDSSGFISTTSNTNTFGTAAYVVANGNVGIGTPSPGYKVDVISGGIAGVATAARFGASGNGGSGRGSKVIIGAPGLANLVEVAEIVGYQNSANSTANNAGLAFNVANTSGALTERVRIDSAGNVGIGGTPANGKLEVFVDSGVNLALTKSTGAYLAFYNGATARASVNGLSGADGLVFGIGSSFTERARINADGNLLVGQLTGDYVISAASSAYNGAKITNLVMGRSGGEYGSVGYGVRYTGTSNSYTYDQTDTASMIRFNTGKVETFTAPSGTGGNAITFTTGPFVAQGGTSWTTPSDERLKDIIEPITDATNKVGQLRAVIGKFKTDPEDKRRSFLIAQDVQAVFSEAVDVSDPESLGVQYTDVIPLLVAAIKEQQAIIQTLTDRITALEGE